MAANSTSTSQSLTIIERRCVDWMAEEARKSPSLELHVSLAIFKRHVPTGNPSDILQGLRRKELPSGHYYLSSFEILGDEIRIYFDAKTHGALRSLPLPFTEAERSALKKFRHRFSRELFEQFLRKKEDAGEKGTLPFEMVLPIADLREHLGIVNAYPRPGPLAWWVLKPAMAEISEITGIPCRYTTMHQKLAGRPLSAVKFEFGVSPEEATQAPVRKVAAAPKNDQGRPDPEKRDKGVLNGSEGSKPFWWMEVLTIADSEPFKLPTSWIMKKLRERIWPREYWLETLEGLRPRLATIEKPVPYTMKTLDNAFAEWHTRRHQDDVFQESRSKWLEMTPFQQAFVRDQLKGLFENTLPSAFTDPYSIGVLEACAMEELSSRVSLPSEPPRLVSAD